ncbi:anti-sigma factor domain-containing protein [Shewanella livingstonensis]|uniref:Anti-sigma factor n=1 Tax=Shewanella livingstonensis TaxID=150120 RepID=A0A3G8LX00_9GAMM|nr:anti-sigma factor [Shewanella livingstonensis]AZG73924.1 anti-sigma factor [Shewanella livingstonensis]
MNYHDPQLKDALAAEYVLGTLRGQARRRFQKLMMQIPSLRESTWLWEQHLHGMNQLLTPIKPDDRVWKNISLTLGFVDNITQTPETSNVVPMATRNRAWKGLASMATAAAIVMAVMVVSNQPVPVAAPQQVAVVQSAQAKALWLIEVTANTIEVRSTSNLKPLENKDYELWMVAKGVENPISLGLLPKSGKLSLVKNSQFDDVDIIALAVSLEPLNGSPNGIPTEVLYTAELAIL